ncbi:MAG TPA: O-antigen ligase family protein, partial [Planctomycetota bacterium]|nr:O-antigen ligase family protein [Planctomycetota bacterium]
MNRAHVLWCSFLAVWALGQIYYGAVAPVAVAATTLALAILLGLSLILLPGGLALSRATVGFLAVVLTIFALQFLPLRALFPATSALRAVHQSDGYLCGTADAFLTLRCLVQVGAYVLGALLVLKLRQEGVSSSTVLTGVSAVLLAQAGYALVQQFAGLPEIPFYGPRPAPDAASGTFVGRNTFAGVMAMGAVGSAALAYSRFLGRRRLESGVGWALATAFFLVALVLSKSRGGAVGAAVGLVLLPLLHRGRGSLAGAAAVLTAGAVGIALADPTVLVSRFNELDAQEIREDTRWRIWATTAAAATHQPVLGFGIGTHPHAYHPYQPVDLPGEVHHAHNEYVNFFFEGGVVWLLALVAGLGVWIARTSVASRRLPGPDRVFPAAALAAVCAEAAHSIVDFDLRTTSAGLLFAVWIGLGGSVQRSSREPSTWRPGLIALVSGVFALLLLGLPLDPEPVIVDAQGSEPARAAALCRRALRISPYHYRAAWILARATDEPDRYATAADLWPAHTGLQEDVGLRFWESGDPARAAVCLARLFEQRPADVEPVLRKIWRRDLPLAGYEALLPRTPAAWGAYAGFIVAKGKWREGLDAFRRGVPETPANAPVFDAFAVRLEAAGQWGMSASILDHRLKVKSDPAAQGRAARAWAKLEAWDRALEAARMARRTDPLNVEWVVLEADVLRANKELEKALEAYLEAVRLAPLEVGVLL